MVEYLLYFVAKQSFIMKKKASLRVASEYLSRQWCHEIWQESRTDSASPLRQVIESPSEDQLSHGLSRLASSRLNRLFTGVGRFDYAAASFGVDVTTLLHLG